MSFRARAAILTSLAIMIVPAVLTSETASQAFAASNHVPNRPISWIAAGDSYSSGQGLPYNQGSCSQALPDKSGDVGAWPFEASHLVNQDLNVSLSGGLPTFVACSGAKSTEFFNPQKSNPIEWTGRRYDFGTFTFGGDDVGFPKVLKQCLGYSEKNLVTAVTLLGTEISDPALAFEAWSHDPLGHCTSTNELRNEISSEIGSSSIGPYGRFLTNVANSAIIRGGNIMVLGYPELVEDPKFWPTVNQALGLCQGITMNDAEELRGLAGDLNATISRAVSAVNKQYPNKVHLTFVDVNTGNPEQGIAFSDPHLFEPNLGIRHNLCAAQPWLNGISILHRSNSFHPNQLGNNAVAYLAPIFHESS